MGVMRLKMNEGGENFEFLREGEREKETERGDVKTSSVNRSVFDNASYH